MKISKSIPIKETKSLFLNRFNYKIELLVPDLRGNTWKARTKGFTLFSEGSLKEIGTIVSKLDSTEFKTRIGPSYQVTIYTNNTKCIEDLSKIDGTIVRSVYMPNSVFQNLDPDTIVLKNVDYKYKVTINLLRERNESFLKWAENNNKINITFRSFLRLSNPIKNHKISFYVKDDKSLTIVKLMVGSQLYNIRKIINP